LGRRTEKLCPMKCITACPNEKHSMMEKFLPFRQSAFINVISNDYKNL
jgi:hypothetical protein